MHLDPNYQLISNLFLRFFIPEHSKIFIINVAELFSFFQTTGVSLK